MSQRETLEVDVLVVGGGPAGLAAAYHLRKLNKDVSIAVLEKGKEIGAHIISGAVMDPRGINELMPDWKEKGAPIEKPVEEDHVLFLTKRRKFGLPIVPPPLQNHGNYIISLNKFTRWFGQQVEQSGVDLFAGFAGAELLIEGDNVVGVRRRQRNRQTGQSQKQLRTGHRHSGKDHDSCRRLPRLAYQTTRSEVQARPGPQSAGLRRRGEGSLGRPEGKENRRARHSHDGLAAAYRRVRRRIHLQHVGWPCFHRFRHWSRLPRSPSGPAPAISGIQDSSLHPQYSRRRHAFFIWRKDDSRRRLLGPASVLLQRRIDHR